MIKTSACFILVTYLLSACSQQVGNYNFGEVHSAKIDESKIILTKFPSAMVGVSDSVVGAINSGQKLSLYNIYSGKNIANFSTEKIKFDSLIKETYQKTYSGKREYVYDAGVAGGLTNGNAQLSSFYYSEGKFYIYISALVQVTYVNDSVALSKYTDNEKVKEAKKMNQDVNIQVMESLEFMFVTDTKLNIQTILPLYERSRLTQDKYSALYQKGFAVRDNKVFVLLLKNDVSFEKMTSKINNSKNLYALASFFPGAGGADKTDYKASYKDMSFNDFSLQDFLSVNYAFQQTPAGLVFSNGKELCNVETGAKIFSNDQLETNEWIQGFYCDEQNHIVLATYKMIPKMHPTQMDITYGVDSVSEVKIKIVNTKHSDKNIENMLDNKINLSFLVTKNKIIYLDKDKENYYFKYFSYNNEK